MKKELVKKIKEISKYVADIKKTNLFDEGYSKYNDYIYEDYGPDNIDNIEIVGRPITSFLLYIGNTRRIGWIKIGFIRDYFDLDISGNSDISNYITSNKVFKKKFVENLPLLMELFIDRQNMLYRKKKKYNNSAFEFIELYRMIGREYLKCDKSEISRDDVERYIYYIDMLEKKTKQKLDEGILKEYEK